MNPILAHPVYLSGYIERLGTGTVDLIERCKENGLKTLEFHFDEDGRVVIWRKNVTPDVTPTKTVIRAKDVLTAILSNKYITTDELADMFKVAPLYTTFHLNQTFYTLYHPEASFSHSEPSLCHSDPLSVILNEVKDLHTQFRVSCPGRK